MDSKVLLSIVIPTLNEAGNIGVVVRQLSGIFTAEKVRHEIIVVDGPSVDGTEAAAREAGATVLKQKGPGYGSAVKEGFAACRGEFVLTMDADQSHNPYFVVKMFREVAERGADVAIGSRYVRFAHMECDAFRKFTSRLLNAAYGRLLDIPISDFSSGYRVYRRAMLLSMPMTERDYNILTEILVHLYISGAVIREVPIHYRPRVYGRSSAKVVKYAVTFLRTLMRMWRLRNTINACDYDSRAFDSRIPPQRHWQRQRYRHILALTPNAARVVDLGCGSSRILEALPQCYGMDIIPGKLRFCRNFSDRLFRGSLFHLPIADAAFDVVISSQVIEHIPMEKSIFVQFNRVLRVGGTLILGTPDYDTFAWRFIEWWYQRLMPNAYADEHISHYTFGALRRILADYGFEYQEHRYIAGGELIIKAQKVRTVTAGEADKLPSIGECHTSPHGGPRGATYAKPDRWGATWVKAEGQRLKAEG